MSDIAVLRKALLSGRSATTSPIAQGIVIEVKVNFMIVEGIGVFCCLDCLFCLAFALAKLRPKFRETSPSLIQNAKLPITSCNSKRRLTQKSSSRSHVSLNLPCSKDANRGDTARPES